MRHEDEILKRVGDSLRSISIAIDYIAELHRDLLQKIATLSEKVEVDRDRLQEILNEYKD